MNRLRDFALLYRSYRSFHRPFRAAQYAWIVSGGSQQT